MVPVIDEKQFNELVNIQKKPVLVDFFATWCGPCKRQSPIVDSLADKIEGDGGCDTAVVKVDIDASPDVAAAYGVVSIPTIIMFKEGNPIEKKIGLQTKDALEKMCGI